MSNKQEALKVDEIKESGIFDAEWYLNEYHDVRRAKVDPVLHYLRKGGYEGRKPSIYFDSWYYLKHNKDVAKSGMSPLLHFVRYGEKGGRNPSPWFDVRAYQAKYGPVESPLRHFIEYAENNFDEVIYKRLFGEMEDCFVHYVQNCWNYRVFDKKQPDGIDWNVVNDMYFLIPEKNRDIFFCEEYKNTTLLFSCMPVTDGVYTWRIKFLEEQLQFAGVENIYTENATEPSPIFYKILHSCKTIIISRPNGRTAEMIVGEALRLRKRLIFDIDDLYDVAYTKDFGCVRSKILKYDNMVHNIITLSSMFLHCDTLMVSTPVLADKMSQFCSDIIIRKNVISESLLKTEKNRKDGPFSILLASGSSTHDFDISTIYPDLINFLLGHPEVKITVLGRANVDFSYLQNPCQKIEFVSFEKMLEIYEENDLLLIPLAKNAFNDAKSNIKFIEAASVLTPVLAQDCEEFKIIKDGVTGYTYSDDFYQKLEYIYYHQEEAQKVGIAANEYVRANLTTSSSVDREITKRINS